MNPDRIEKKILLRAPLGRVWRAISDSKEFGAWFGVKFDDPFTPGALMRGVVVGTVVDAEVAKLQRQFGKVAFEITIEKIEPQRLFSFRWHPHAIEPGVDYSGEATTLIEFVLEPAPEGVLLTVTESGFDRIPLARRAQAFSGNDQGWDMMVKIVQKYVEDAG